MNKHELYKILLYRIENIGYSWIKLDQFLTNKFNKIIPLTKLSEYQPIFIISAGRSGNTLLRTMLCSHPDIAIPPESFVLPMIIIKSTINRLMSWEKTIEMVINQFQNHPQFDSWEINLNPLKKKLLKTKKNKQSITYIIDQIYRYYAKKHFPKAKIWLDKTPIYVFFLKWLDIIYPQAKYIHLIRDGRAVVHSLTKHNLISNQTKAIKRWNESIERTQKFENKHKNQKILTIYYEKLITNPKKQLRMLSDFIDINFDSKMLTYYQITDKLADVKNYKIHQNVSRKLDRSIINKWKKELSNEQISYLTEQMHKNLKLHHYI